MTMTDPITRAEVIRQQRAQLADMEKQLRSDTVDTLNALVKGGMSLGKASLAVGLSRSRASQFHTGDHGNGKRIKPQIITAKAS